MNITKTVGLTLAALCIGFSGFKFLRYALHVDCSTASQLTKDIVLSTETNPMDWSKDGNYFNYLDKMSIWMSGHPSFITITKGVPMAKDFEPSASFPSTNQYCVWFAYKSWLKKYPEPVFPGKVK